MGDPLFTDGVDGVDVVIVLIKTLVVFVFLLVSVLLYIWFMRKVISDMQNRIGPNVAGPWGLLQTLADGIKAFFKEHLLPEQADKRIYHLAPYLSTVPAFLAFAIVPVGGRLELFDRVTTWQLADPPVGILFLLAASSIAVYGVMLAGWSSGSKYPLLGSVRASAQMVSYEAAMGLSVAGVILIAGSLSTSVIAGTQDSFFEWNLFQLGVVPFAVFLIAGLAELNHPPFDLVEAEQELVGGFHTEYASVRFALFYLAEFMNLVTMSAIVITLFLGGPYGPDVPVLTDVSPVWFLLKLLVLLFGSVWVRATFPRYRYDQLMDLGWKRLIPLSLGWLLLIAALRVGEDEGWNRALVIGGGLVSGAVAWALLALAMRIGATADDVETGVAGVPVEVER